MISVRAIPILSDNYAWLLRDAASGAMAIVDPADAAPVALAIDAAIAEDGGHLALILLTHHHGDHIAGTDEIRDRFGARVIGASADAHRLPRLDQAVAEGSEIRLGDTPGFVLETPGPYDRPTSPSSSQARKSLICGDTLFSLGCGRLLEGTPADMFASLGKLAALSSDMLVYCGHEYTMSNARFARHADPDNRDLPVYAQRVEAMRAEGLASVPSRLSDELACNPFLRAPDVATLGRSAAPQRSFLTQPGKTAMRLFQSPTSPFARKVIGCAIAREIDGQIELVAVNAAQSPPALLAINPLSKIPALVTEDGVSLYDSVVICEYLDTIGDAPPLFPATGRARWRALKQQAMGDGIMDAAVLRRGEVLRPREDARDDNMARQRRRRGAHAGGAGTRSAARGAGHRQHRGGLRAGLP